MIQIFYLKIVFYRRIRHYSYGKKSLIMKYMLYLFLVTNLLLVRILLIWFYLLIQPKTHFGLILILVKRFYGLEKIFLFVFQDFSMLALVDDFITLHFTLNTIRIREKGIIIGNELIFRRETLDTFDPKYKVMY